MTGTKDVIRFYRKNNRKKLIHYGVTEAQAKEWCESPYTKKEGVYFDGFAQSDTHCIYSRPFYDHYFTPDKDNH